MVHNDKIVAQCNNDSFALVGKFLPLMLKSAYPFLLTYFISICELQNMSWQRCPKNYFIIIGIDAGAGM